MKKKKKKMTKAVSVSLVTLLAASNLFYAGGKAWADEGTPSINLEQAYKTIEKAKQLSIKKQNEYQDSDEVRVIVELDGDPAISYANEKGVMYKQLTIGKQEELQQQVKSEQDAFLNNVKMKKINLKKENAFTTVLNGVSGKMKYGDIEKIEQLPGVKKVTIATEYERPKEKPDMISSKEMVEAQQTWNTGYDGKGTVIGIIDTGIDVGHKDMKLTTEAGDKLTETSVKEKIAEQKLSGQFYTNKVPYGYNYADKNSEIRDLGPDASMHGMHVAGTVGANGDETGNGIKGVAPESQLLALKVFGNDPAMPSTFGDIYIKAIDDGIKLGADVMNMSLGSAAGFVDDQSLEQKAVDNAVQNGVVMSISAGNEGYVGNGFGTPPLATNPDTGLVGAPSVTKSSLSVASMENNRIALDEMTMSFGSTSLSYGYKTQSSPLPLNVFGNKQMDVVNVGDGSAAQYAGKDVKGKMVFAARVSTNPNYGEIQKAAETAGAAGVIVKGLPAHGDYVSMALNAPTIPLVSIGQSDGNAMLAEFAKNNGLAKVSFTGKKVTVPSAAAGTMSTFTSWGVTPSLEMKPEITAPGGQIYSTLNDDKYGLMSGTSMAAPHVSGGAALVLQKVHEMFPNLTGAEKSERAKVLMMNTAKPVEDPNNGGIFYSPRRQGSGIMQLHSAVSTPVYVVRKGTNEGKVELKEINGNTVSFTLTATNMSDEDATYEVDTSALTDSVTNGLLDMKEKVVSKAKISVDTPVFTLFKGQSKDITIRINLDNANAELENAMSNGYFLEGFVQLIDKSDQAFPNLTVPFVGFKGDWNKAPVLDPMVYDQGTYLDTSFMVDDEGNALGQNGVSGQLDKNTIAISPNGDNQKDAAAPVLTFLRNSKTVEYSILDESGKTVRTITKDGEQRKNYKLNSPYVYKPSTTTWDGFIKSKKAKDGKYFYQVKTQVDYAGKEPQTMKIPVVVDTVAPVFGKTAFSSKNGIVSFELNDGTGSGLQLVQIQVDGKAVKTLDATGQSSFKVDVGKISSKSKIVILAMDNADNMAGTVVKSASDDTIPYIVTTSPEALGVFDTKEIPLTGSVKDASELAYLKVKGDKLEGNEINVPFTFNEKTKDYDFDTKLKFTEDGVHDVYISGEDGVGNKIEFRRQVIIDTTPAQLEITGIPEGNLVGGVKKEEPANGKTEKPGKPEKPAKPEKPGKGKEAVTTAKADNNKGKKKENPSSPVDNGGTGNVPASEETPDITLHAKVTDNFDDIRLVVWGDEVFKHSFDDPYEMRPFSKEIDIPLFLDEGQNDVTFEVTDLAGHVTTQTVVLYKGAKPESTGITSYSFTPEGKVTSENPAVLKAEASAPVKWEAVVTDPSGNKIPLASTEGKTFETTYVPDANGPAGEYTIEFGLVGGEKKTVTFQVADPSDEEEFEWMDWKPINGPRLAL
ncbi:S8 family serine peptidase [Bacillus testis]|uniref:S8 family serine peptidase n=1 Tax=Bacillus testis TaxID=1622072 RepID=UPI00067F62EA|nr:S8 family serine peptidase [Bacillus testis]